MMWAAKERPSLTWALPATTPGCPRPGDADDSSLLRGKARGPVEWAARRRFVRVDDEIADAGRTWVATHHNAAGFLHRVDPEPS